MSTFWMVFYILLGFTIGRIYARMKYHYPEHVEAIALKTAKLRAERMRHEANAERWRSEIDESLEQRMK